MDVAVGLRSVAVPSPPGWRALNPLSVAYPTLSDALLSADWLLEEDDVVCTPAPPPDDAGRYRLTDSTGKLLEKRLRTLLSRCPEWNDAGARMRLAAALEAEEAASGLCSGAVEVLRLHSSSRMRKHAMLRLAHAWRYRSDCWAVRDAGGGGRKRARRTSPPADEAADAEASPRDKRAALSQAAVRVALADRTLTVSQAAQAQMRSYLAPFIAASAHAWTGPQSAREFGRASREGMTWLRVRWMDGALEVSDWLRGVFVQRLRGLRAWRATLDEATLHAPSYLCDDAYTVLESEFDVLRIIANQSRNLTDANTERSRQADGGLLPQHAAWAQDFHEGHAAVMAMLANARAFCAAQRTQPLRAFLDAAEAALDGLSEYNLVAVESLQRRVKWTSEAAEAQGAAAGCRLEAQAALPPLVQRLRLTGDDVNGARLLALATTPPPLGAPLPPFTLIT